jgi:ketosteroid isomerase-like protein
MEKVIDSRWSSGETTEVDSALDDFLSATLPRLMQEEEALHNGDVEPRLAIWSRKDPVTVFGALGPNRSGWDKVSQSFRWVAARFSNCREYTFELVAAGVSGDLAYTAGYERSTHSVNGAPPQSNVLRVTHVYRRENGEWKIIHRHADYPPVDQSPPPTPISDGPVVS